MDGNQVTAGPIVTVECVLTAACGRHDEIWSLVYKSIPVTCLTDQ